MLKHLFVCLAICSAASASAMSFGSQHAIVVNNESGEILFEENASSVVPIASLTKLMTAMVVLDSKPDMEEKISIQLADVDMFKHSASHVPLGTTLPRREVLQLALMSSDNRAAASLARTYPGGNPAFVKAVHEKIKSLGMINTVIKEPTGLSPENASTAADLAKMAFAASRYPVIVNITTDRSDLINMQGRSVEFHNTNRLVGKRGWDILLSKTGFTNEAGHCLIMRIKLAGKNTTLVLLNAKASSSTFFDALNIRRFLAKQTILQPSITSTLHKRHHFKLS
ncbi:murein-DD-endopeptidase. Serine peptidase. MEROPS family S11 [Rhodoferax ferrireducens T118]|uniref:Murein-DD-endopeptidase. Serine peptidase. MEROPS family S11 n=1 Tax=Albidiferax ferrireducens (strain ATCC BAA-621 / DSM 15236 / T118) TaxID=338969 RepID=Q21ZB1_ALBFT|nr:serine hydrolase [Rhodoferax ferrireducens]ABD68892.1 murein-DD-endopeptidase. Serine peptidase. MEROPS family S11 [Rhodoferax ferrireducens T118]